MDRRIARTRSALHSALHQKMHEMPWDQISIQQLCDAADVSRSTFYMHFDNKQQLLDFAFVMLEEELKAPYETRGLRSHGTFEFLPHLINHVERNCDLFRTNSRSPTGFAIFNRFKLVVDQLIKHEMQHNGMIGNNSREEIAFVSGGIFAILDLWNQTGCKTPVETLTHQIDSLVSRFLRQT